MTLGHAAPTSRNVSGRDKEQILQIEDFELFGTDIGLDVSALTTAGWLPAVVPGGVHESLLAAGRIEHPFQDRNEDDVRLIEERHWWFRASFAVSADLAQDERARLVFLGFGHRRLHLARRPGSTPTTSICATARTPRYRSPDCARTPTSGPSRSAPGSPANSLTQVN